MRLSDYVRDIEPQAGGAPEPVIVRTLEQAARDFCRRSGIWRQDLDPVSLTADEAQYDFDAPFGADVEFIVHAYYGESALSRTGLNVLLAASRSGATGAPTHIAAETGQQFRLYPTPDSSATKTVTVHAALVPTREEVPDWLARYRDALVYGALWRLMEAPGQPWSNVQAAQYYDQAFRQEAARAKREALTSFGAPQSVRPQRFGA